MNILVTGGLGILGCSILRNLSKSKNNIFVYDKKKNFKYYKKLALVRSKFIPGELTNFNKIERTIIKYKIKAIFHLGAQTQVLRALRDPEDTYKINLISTIKILEIIRNLDKKILFIYSSSDKAYGELKSGSYYENHPLSSIYPYDVSKSTSDLIAQSYSRTYNLKVGIIRSANIFGPNDKNLKRIVPETVVNLLNKKKIIIRSNGKLKRDYIYVDDVANAYLLTFKKLLKRKNNLLIYNVGSKYNLSVIEIVKKIAIIMKIKGKFFVIKNNSKQEINNQRLNYSKISRELGWKQKISLNEGLAKTINWYKNNLSMFKL